MCGIIGSINCKFKKNYLSVLKHRGPDDEGQLKYKNVNFAHLRLSILDTSDSGHQPMSTEDGRFEIIFNGEIYNHLTLRKELRKHGYSFYSGSDTETLLKGWNCWGKNILEKLNGIFAFAILDKKKNRLFLVRDHHGIKPLYIYEKGKKIGFSSELKIFDQIGDFDDTLNPEVLTQYLSFLWAPGEQTPYKFVRKLLPGHFLEIPLTDPTKNIEKEYFRLPFDGNYIAVDDEGEITDHLDNHLKKAVERQLLSDVPLGFFLSGGLDSSLIVAVARHLYPDRNFDCFTIASNMQKEGKGFEDDLPYAQKVADYLNIDLHVIEANSDIAQQFDHMIWHLDEPQADPAPINVFNISKGARNMGIKVLLGGTAGDDLFSGYRRHQALTYDKYLEYIPVPARRAAQIGINEMLGGGALARKLRKLSRDWEKPMQQRMLGYFNWLPNDDYVYSLFKAGILDGRSTHATYAYFKSLLNQQSPGLSYLDQLLYLEMKTFLVDHNLNYTDKMSMAAGVEVRVPYLDKELVELAGKIPSELKLKKGETKYILKKVAERYLPEEVIYRTKTGFGAPIRNWLRNELQPMVNERLSSHHLKKQGIFNAGAVQSMIKQNKSGKFDFSYPLWALLSIQSWLKQFKWSL